MAKGYSNYTRTEKIRARKVTADEGEKIVSEAGVLFAPKGSYVTERENSDGTVVNDVQDADNFEATWGKPKGAKKKAAKKATKKAAPVPAKKAESDDPVSRAKTRAASRTR